MLFLHLKKHLLIRVSKKIIFLIEKHQDNIIIYDKIDIKINEKTVVCSMFLQYNIFPFTSSDQSVTLNRLREWMVRKKCYIQPKSIYRLLVCKYTLKS